MQLLNKIDELKKEWDALQPIEEEYEDVLWQKFRLEWNYNSNHIEGNTLSLGETELLLKLGDEFRAQNNSLKDVNEMKAHDVAIHMIREWGKDESRELLEKDIRELNETILVKDYWADAQTPDGQPTRRLIKVGEYKSQPNHVVLKSGEIFRYAEPSEVPAEMQELLEWYGTFKKENHPLVTAAFLHYKFVLIHPFDDGNGRVSRLLMNLHLMKNGYPPIIIKSKDKENYLYALRQADTGDLDAFVEYLAKDLLWSLDLSVKAGKGESVEEKDDLNKEIEVWKKEKVARIGKLPLKNKALVISRFTDSIKLLFKEFHQQTKVFDDLYDLTKRGYQFSYPQKFSTFGISPDFQELPTIELNEIIDIDINKIKFVRAYTEYFNPVDKNLELEPLIIYVVIKLEQYGYKIYLDQNSFITKSYNELLNEQEVESIVKIKMKNLFKHFNLKKE